MRERVKVKVHFKSPSRTKQCFRDECNVNTIMAKYQKTGLLPHVDMHKGQYGDFTNVQSYQDSLNQVMAANEMFSSLPSSLRARFENDPAQFLSFVDDPANRDEMRDLGLLQDNKDSPRVVPLPGDDKKSNQKDVSE